jgi:hypothetical protein
VTNFILRLPYWHETYFLTIIADGVCAVFSRLEDRSVGHDEVVALAVEAIQGLLGRGDQGV